MKKYFSKSEASYIIDLLENNDLDYKLLGLDFIISHPNYKNFKKLYVYRSKLPFYSTKIKISTEISTWKYFLSNESFHWLCRGYNFDRITNFIKKRIYG